jgi:citrate lyase subunit alpha/citrate CoA-transferase
VTDNVYSVTTPGEVVDAIVTEYGITINPKRKDLLEACSAVKGLPLVSMDELVSRAHKMSGPTDPVATEDRIIGVVEWRDGTVIDVVRQLKTK